MSRLARSIAAASLLSLALLGACGGEVPKLTQVVRPTDNQMSCMDLLRETNQNDLEIARLVDRDDQVHRRNVHFTVVDGVMFPPAMLTLDLRDQAAKEMSTVRARNDRLIELANMNGC
ncbi:MAG: hypothetical protein HYU58_21335 [Proteobacteria bacterium]|nr:hypothetical protein [Pseudomonadota bacterium]